VAWVSYLTLVVQHLLHLWSMRILGTLVLDMSSILELLVITFGTQLFYVVYHILCTHTSSVVVLDEWDRIL
jgi:hypothetical protein